MGKDGANSRDRSIFRPFYRKVDAVLKGMARTVKDKTGKDDPSALSDLHVLELLLIDRQTDLA
ncbi:hypothetical protein, partial [Stenotrophomonas maltophilia]|uniref:hypothetical protein n=1 Tax=Stenotrophomonas maltophilia TaxID=40324 RepID=UPI001954DA42